MGFESGIWVDAGENLSGTFSLYHTQVCLSHFLEEDLTLLSENMMLLQGLEFLLKGFPLLVRFGMESFNFTQVVKIPTKLAHCKCRLNSFGVWRSNRSNCRFGCLLFRIQKSGDGIPLRALREHDRVVQRAEGRCHLIGAPGKGEGEEIRA